MATWLITAIWNWTMTGANPLDRPNSAGLCALHLAAERGEVEHLERLLDLGMHPSASDLDLAYCRSTRELRDRQLCDSLSCDTA
jgi:hypothetical protein